VNKLASDAQAENLAIAEEQKGSTQALSSEKRNEVQANQELIGSATELNDVVDDANSKFKEQQAVLFGLIEDAGTATAQVDELGNTVYSLPDGTQILVSAETGQATTDVSTFKGDLDEIPSSVVTTVRVRVDPSEWDN